MEGRTPGEFVFRRPDGSLLPVCPVPFPVNGRAGEVMDIHMAVDGLLDCEPADADDEE